MSRSMTIAVAMALASCGGEAPTATATESQDVDSLPEITVAARETECAADQSECWRWGRPGVCIQSRCVLTGACSYDQDCEDSGTCTRDWCDRGECRSEPLSDLACTDGEAAGECRAGRCVPSPPETCADASECEQAAGECRLATCNEGRCRYAPAENGSQCELASGLVGACADATCVELSGEAARPRRCRTLHTAFGDYEECTESTLQYALSPEDLAREASRIEERIREGVLYDVHVSLVPLAGGGYNILIFNRRSRSEVQGLVDPSFVAFEVGGYTSRSRWRSRTLQIWLTPYTEGWQISTEGGRRALRRGRAASGLGFLGVVNIRAFRTWLQAAFRPIEAPAPDPGNVSDAAPMPVPAEVPD